jgi:hypothetical protein
MSFALRAFVVLQSNAAMLTEEVLGHVGDVQATLEALLEAPQSAQKARSGSPQLAPAGWKLAGGSLRDWLGEDDDEEEELQGAEK